MRDMAADAEGRTSRICFVLLAVLGLALAWKNRFVQDDAFIAFDYARALVRGEGLTWFGARVEGYVDFGWIVWIALGLRLGFDAVDWSFLGGFVGFAIALLATWRLAGIVLDGLAPRVIALLLLATNFSFTAYATGGLETMAHAAAITFALALATELAASAAPPSRARLALLSATFGLAVLLRVDSALPCAVLFACAVFFLRARGALGAASLSSLVVPGAALVVPWLVWKVGYYGALLPNVFHVKVGNSAGALENGLLYVGRFLHWYCVWPVIALGVLLAITSGASREMRGIRAMLRRGRVAAPALLVLVSWLAYVAFVGGDFMEFRLLVPVMPALFVLVVRLLDAPAGSASSNFARGARLAIAPLAIGVAGFVHAARFDGMTDDRTLDSIPALRNFYGLYADGDWSRVGGPLGRELKDTGAVIATSACGAIPWFSELKTVDMCGLTDAEVARNGNRAGPDYRRPGHRVAARQSDLAAAGVHLIVGHPLVVPRGSLTAPGSDAFWKQSVLGMAFLHESPIDLATLVAMPISADSSLVMWYLTRHPAIDAKLASGAWEQRRVIVGE